MRPVCLSQTLPRQVFSITNHLAPEVHAESLKWPKIEVFAKPGKPIRVMGTLVDIAPIGGPLKNGFCGDPEVYDD